MIRDMLKEKEKTHGEFAKVAETASALKLALKRGNPIECYHVEALTMICSKMARIVNGNPNEIDHWKDIAGYAELVVIELEKANNQK